MSVSYRSARVLIDCLRSIEGERSAPGINLRAVVVDNASGDLPVLTRAVQDNGWVSWVRLIAAPRNGGFAYGNNLGVRLAIESGGADYLLLLNPDTLVRPGAIASLVAFLENRRDVGIAGPSFENLDGTEWPMAFRFPSLATELAAALGIGLVTRLLGNRTVERRMSPVAQQVDWVSGAALMIRAEVFAAIGGLDENYFLYFEETDFCLRAARAGFPTWYFPASRIMHIMGQSTNVIMEGPRTPKRLPGYWYESRRRYLAASLGTAAAMASDLIVLLAYPLGCLKQILLGRGHAMIPHYLRDIWRHSILRAHNREQAPVRTYAPAQPQEASARPLKRRSASGAPLG